MKHLQSYKQFEDNNPNLAINTNPIDFQWTGGDISASPNPDKYKNSIDTIKPEKPNPKREQKKRRVKFNSDRFQMKVNKMSGYNTTDDMTKNIFVHEPTQSHDYTTAASSMIVDNM